MFFKKIQKKRNKKSGFTLIELMAVLVIFVALTGVVMNSQKSFDGTILLNNLAYDIALSVRQAQTYGVNVREFSTTTTSSAFSGYGIRFDPNNDNKHYILFADVYNNNYFNISNSDPACPKNDLQCVERYALTRGSFISSVCVGLSVSDCYPPTGADTDKSVSIVFRRPNPNATIMVGSSGATCTNNKPCQFAKIVISSSGGQTKSIIVTALGQIYVE